MTERAYSWDEPEIQNPKESSEFVVLPAGVYPFTVTKFERGRHEGSAKLPPCPKAIVTIEIDGGEAGTTTRKENLFLHTKTEGLLCTFFMAIGHRKHGEPLRMNWDRVVGATGTCKIAVRKYTKDGEEREANEVKAWLEPSTDGSTVPADDDVIPF